MFIQLLFVLCNEEISTKKPFFKIFCMWGYMHAHAPACYKQGFIESEADCFS